ncbi:hypothetical protein JCM10908_001140 [Rhodotorula pacifica]|uniref:tetrahydrofolate synthase n=1 Tax=Rhodotorula pacifica TaxID=1495444 RepID=UPI00316B971D
MASGIPTRSYAQAIDALNGLQSNAAVIEAIRKSGGKGGDVQLKEQLEYMQRIGYTPSDLNRMNVLHITGTKGKGSTSAFVSSLLTTLSPNAKIGLYTSPHMVAVRERIRINGDPIPEDMFARYFWEVWDKLEADQKRADPVTPEKPAYFRYLTIMAMHVFLQERVDATVLEVGVGGTYDSTNIVPQPLTTGVTALGIDHIWVLGKTLPEIAHQKGGIYKAGVPALAIEQDEGLDVLESRAKELQASSFTVVPEHPQLKDIKLGLAGIHQRSNASLAVALVRSFLSSERCPPAFSAATPSSTTERPTPTTSSLPSLPTELIAPIPLPEAYVSALERTRWPGRCQLSPDPKDARIKWYLDGAHTVESLKCSGEWFAEEALTSQTSATRALIFNCTSGRSGLSLLGALTSALSPSSDASKNPHHIFKHVIFCTNTTYASGSSKGGEHTRTRELLFKNKSSSSYSRFSCFPKLIPFPRVIPRRHRPPPQPPPPPAPAPIPSEDLTSNAVDAKDLETLATQRELAAAWEELVASLSPSSPSGPATQVHVLASIEEAIYVVRKEAQESGAEVQALVTGSLHLVGGVMAVADLPL